ncbi:GTP cyclohydrolase II [Candidatus Daviesbacteria bacterium]|nr:GTP cyclohydrolase II [Candidatus Daviesbacteria bacterium]
MKFASYQKATEEINKGRMLILYDPYREKEGDFYIPADKITHEMLTTMIRLGGGLICVAITQKQAFKLNLPLMIASLENEEKTGVSFTVSVNSKKGITTGVSINDRLKTIKVLANPNSKPTDLSKPGHVFGLIAKNGGLLERAGHTEAAVDLAILAGLNPVGVVCEIISDDGQTAKLPELIKIANQLRIKIVSIADLVKHLTKNPLPVKEKATCIVKTATAKLPTEYGLFKIIIYKSLSNNREHAALTLGKLIQPAIARIHSQCLTGDTFTSLRCDCGPQLRKSMGEISRRGQGIILYLNQEGRDIGLTNKIKAYSLQDQGFDTVEANEALGFPSDPRSYEIAADILKDLGITDIYLLTNNPDKKDQLSKYGINIRKRVALEIKPNKIDLNYLKAKKRKMRHLLKYV